MYKKLYEKLQPYFGRHKLELSHMDPDSFIFLFKPFKGTIEFFKKVRKDFVFIQLDTAHELRWENFYKVIWNLKSETAPGKVLEEAILLGNKSFFIINKPNERKTKYKGVQDHMKCSSEDYKNCLEENEF